MYTRRVLSVFLPVLLLAGVLTAGPAGAAVDCDIMGTEGDDVIVGTAASEVICGLGGDDLIRGRGGSDVIYGGAGNDTIFAGRGHDKVEGGKGDDVIDGQRGRDRLYGQSGSDTLEGATGRDRLRGGPGTDVCADPSERTSILGCESDQPAPRDPELPVIVDAGGILVAESIASSVVSLLQAAAVDGFTLSGGGYRDPAAQVALRRVNCGTTQYAIWEMPASQCSPPTAIPGRSQHEKGLAIDFTNDGELIQSTTSAAYLWLEANAETFGLYVHPAEPWHWSVNGN